MKTPPWGAGQSHPEAVKAGHWASLCSSSRRGECPKSRETWVFKRAAWEAHEKSPELGLDEKQSCSR